MKTHDARRAPAQAEPLARARLGETTQLTLQSGSLSLQQSIDLSPRVTMQRQALERSMGTAIQPPAGEQAVVQRLDTPVPRTFLGMFDWGGSDVKDHGKFFRAHLETLQWQMIATKTVDGDDFDELNRLLALDDPALAKAEKDVVALIKRAPKTKKPSGYEKPQTAPLSADQQIEFGKVVTSALQLIDKTQGDQAALESVFGTAQVKAAAEGFDKIAGILKGWLISAGEGEKSRVQFNKSNSHYAAYCEGIGEGDKAVLMLGSKAFADSNELIATLIHEGSHGALATSDLAYVGSAVFSRVTGTVLSLRNADHYKLASDLVASGKPMEKQSGKVEVGIEEALQQGAQLCAYKCHKVKRLIDWTIPLYQSKNMAHNPDVVDVHEQQMDLGGPARGDRKPDKQGGGYPETTATKIAIARSESFALALAVVNGFISTDKEIAVNGTQVTCKAKSKDWEGKTVVYDLGVAHDATAIAKILFLTTLKTYGLSDKECLRLFDWHEAMWTALLKAKDKESVYHQTADEMMLFDILRG